MTSESNPKFDAKPEIARWELYSLATMLVSTHGDAAEAHASMRLFEAQDVADEAAEITWSGVLTQLHRLRSGG